MAAHDLFMYLISHNRTDIKTHTYIGCVRDFNKRLQQHNGQLSGGPRVTKRAAGSWDPVIIIKLPKDRTFDSKQLKKEWKQSSRGIDSRIKKGFAIAYKYKLTCYIMKSPRIGSNVLKFLTTKWKGEKVQMTKKDWHKVLKDNA